MSRFGKGRAGLLLLSLLLLLAVVVVVATHQAFARDLRESLAGLGATSLAVALVIVIAQVACQSLRFWAVVPADTPLSVVESAYVFTLGDWTNVFAPARGGDALKVVLMTRAGSERRISVPRAIGAVLADKIVDVGAILLLCVITGTLILFRAEARAPAIGPGLALTLSAVVALLLAAILLARASWLLRLRDLWDQLLQGLSALRDPSRCLISVTLGLGAWTAESLVLHVLSTRLGFTPSPAQLVFTLVLLNIGISVPVSVASVGVYEASLAYGLNRSGLPLPAALAVATAHHVVELVGLGLCTAACSLQFHLARRLGRSATAGLDLKETVTGGGDP